MVSVQELYELWADDAELNETLKRSLDPRGTDWLFDLFASLGPERGQLLVDVGARDARHAVQLARDHGLRVVALEPLAQHVEHAREVVAEAGAEDEVEVVEAWIHAIPLPDAAADWVWCRDVLFHVDLTVGLPECARVLAPGGRMVAYATLASDLLEPREAAALANSLALVRGSLDSRHLEQVADQAGFELVDVYRLDGEWHARMIEDGSWDAGDTLLRLSRLRRRRAALVETFGEAAVDAYWGGKVWPVYHLLGKLVPSVYVWQRRG
jgi:SAM-dependent methyltransferase